MYLEMRPFSPSALVSASADFAGLLHQKTNRISSSLPQPATTNPSSPVRVPLHNQCYILHPTHGRGLYMLL